MYLAFTVGNSIVQKAYTRKMKKKDIKKVIYVKKVISESEMGATIKKMGVPVAWFYWLTSQ